MKTSNHNYRKDLMLAQPITVKHMTMKNRMVMPGMGTLFGEPDGSVGERMLQYIEARARGGVGLIIIEYTAVSPDGRASALELGLWDDRFIGGLSRLAETAHRYGARIGIQLHHAGRSTSSEITGFPPVGPSALEGTKGEVARELTIQEIKDLVQAYSEAALRAKKAGFDCVEIHGAHGYLLSQFMSPFSNRRTDDYGGSRENRMRFPLEAVRAVREAVGDDFTVTYRISAYDALDGGRTEEDTAEECKMLEAAGIDVINVSVGMLESGYMILTGGKIEPGFLADAAGRIRNSVHIPVIAVGKFHTPEIAEKALREGKADMVALGRALLVDPEFPNKVLDGRFEEIRQCIHCLNGCYSEPVTCTQNPLLGHEALLPYRAALPVKDVLIVGAGPAGMEAALVCALRGHRVTVLEKEAHTGGQIALMEGIPHKEDFFNIIEVREKKVRALGAAIVTGKEFTLESVKVYRPDVILFATGAVPVMPDIEASGGKRIISAFEALKNTDALGKKIAVVGGGAVGSELAEKLAASGRKVSVIEMKEDIAADIPFGNRIWVMKELEERDVRIYTGTAVKAVSEEGVLAEKEGKQICIEADDIVMAVGSRPGRSCYEEVKKKYPEIETCLIGDAKKVRRIIDAIADANKAARSV